jgi:short-subunit dehydrogenase
MKTALITGASSGFGFMLTEKLLERGWTVLASLRRLEDRRALFHELLKNHGDRLQLLELDLEKPETFEAAIASLRANQLSLDCLINNAGFGVFGSLEDISDSLLRKQFEVNLFGLCGLTKKLLPELRKTRGRILNLSSTVGFTGMPLAGAYVSSKFALEGMMESLAYDLHPQGVKVCLIQPGAFKTKFGSNIVWGENAMSEKSIYSKRVQAFKRFRDSVRKSPPPDRVVEKILWACEARQLPLRIRVGKDAALAFWSRKILSGGLYTHLLRWAFDRALKT